MAVRWYYKVMGQEAGPVSASELKELAASGFLTPDVLLRKGDEGAWFPSGNVRGLFEPAGGSAGPSWPGDGAGPPAEAKIQNPSPPTAAEPPSAEIARGVAEEDSGAAAPAGPQPADAGWHYQAKGRTTGPVPSSTLKELADAGFLTPDVLVRKGDEGDWIASGNVRGLFEQAGGTAGVSSTGDGAGPPAEAKIPKRRPAATAEPPPAEVASGAVEEGPGAATPAVSQPADAGWYYQAKGRTTGPVPSSTLKDLADAGGIVPETLVRKGAGGRWVAARQVKDLFKRRGAGATSKEANRQAAGRPAAEMPPQPPPESAPIVMAYPVGEPVPEPAGEPLADSGLELLPESALEPLPPQPAARPQPAGGMGDFLNEALAEPKPSETESSDIYGTVPVTLPPRPPGFGSRGAAVGGSPKPKRRRKRRKKSASESGGILGGIGLMLAAVVWFIGGLAVGYIFFYPPILFLIGLGVFVKGIFAAISGED